MYINSKYTCLCNKKVIHNILWTTPVFWWITCVFPVDNLWITRHLSTPRFYQISSMWILWTTTLFIHRFSTNLSTSIFRINKGFTTLFNIIHTPTTITTNNKLYIYYKSNQSSKGDPHVNHLQSQRPS